MVVVRRPPCAPCARPSCGFRAQSAREPGCPSARPLGQCCRYSRQHCTGLALRGSPASLARRRVARPRAALGAWWRGQRARVRARRRLLEGHAVTRYAPARMEAAQRRARCPQGEPSAMLPAVSAALAERSPEGHWDASERSTQNASQ
jgi:hypothetical protein